MTRKLIQLAMAAAGMSLAIGTLSACSDDSTATAPITSDPVTTTSMYTSSASVSASPSAQPEESRSQKSASDDDAATPPPSGAAAGTRLPATAPATGTTAPQSFSGPDGQPVSEKGKRYLAALKADNVTFMGDTDNNIALTMAEYVCAEQRKNTDPVTVKAFITASVGPGTKTVAEANAKADKVINAAHDNYC